MNVFLSWSGDISKAAAKEFNLWLGTAFPKRQVKVFFSADDVGPGWLWREVLSKALKESSLGVFFLSRENLDSPWVLFEGGAIGKLPHSRVFTVLLDISPSDLPSPFEQYQATRISSDSYWRLVKAITELAKRLRRWGGSPAIQTAPRSSWRSQRTTKPSRRTGPCTSSSTDEQGSSESSEWKSAECEPAAQQADADGRPLHGPLIGKTLCAHQAVRRAVDSKKQERDHEKPVSVPAQGAGARIDKGTLLARTFEQLHSARTRGPGAAGPEGQHPLKPQQLGLGQDKDIGLRIKDSPLHLTGHGYWLS